MRALEKQVADISEEFQIEQGKFKHLQKERERYIREGKELKSQIQQIKEVVQDKDEKIDQVNSKVEIMTQENTQIKEAYEKLMVKLSYLQENHIMIPKDGKRLVNQDNKVNGDDDSLNNLQEEVRNLHFTIKNKDSLIEKLKQALIEQQEKGNSAVHDEDIENSE